MVAMCTSPPTNSGLVFRDNSAILSQFPSSAIFLRPTQLGKSTLLHLARALFSKDREAPDVEWIPARPNTSFVLLLDFLEYSSPTEDLLQAQEIDKNLLPYTKREVEALLTAHVDLSRFYTSPTQTPSLAGNYISALANAVELYGKDSGTQESLVVLIDEYDKPMRDLLLNVAGYDTEDAEGATTLQVQRAFKNYVSLFSAAKLVVQKSVLNKVWTTGVTPVALDLLSDYTPENLTFHHSTATVVGLTSEDVDRMLNLVDERNNFSCVQEKERAREAIRNFSNSLYFLSDTPIYHTRLVNKMMSMLDTQAGRKSIFSTRRERLRLGVILREHSIGCLPVARAPP
jgi:hypothetical protein